MSRPLPSALPAASAQPLEALWQAPALFSVVLAGEGLAAVLALAPFAGGDRWVYFGLASLLIQWVAFLSIGALYLLRRTLVHWRPQAIAWLALALVVLNTFLVGSAASYLLRSGDLHPERSDPTFILRLTALALTVGFFGLAVFQNYWRARQMAVQAKQAELEALHARIQPHFLFNTLNTGAALVHARPEEAERLLLDLADLFRAALAGPRIIQLADELALARRYLEIESLRFGQRLRVRWNLPEPLPTASLPALSIQPLVENAIRHGIEPASDGGAVEIAVAAIAGAITVTVANDLPPAGTAAAQGHRVGLAAVRERVRALDPQHRDLLQTRTEAGRYVAVLSLPTNAITTASSG